MYLHLGQDSLVNTKDIVGVFDLDTSTVAKDTRDYLAAAEKAGQVINVSMELPKSFVVAAGGGLRANPSPFYGEKRQNMQGKMRKNPPQKTGAVYISQLSSATLKGRYEELF